MQKQGLICKILTEQNVNFQRTIKKNLTLLVKHKLIYSELKKTK